ncbi:MAG: HEAT repeat domain-containing protein [Kiritimatiellia bacterium]
MILTRFVPLPAVPLAALFAAVNAVAAPDDLLSTRFSGSDKTPSPACLCVAPTGEVFVGVDLNGSLGKGAQKGRIVRLVDADQDGVADRHTVFAEIDNPRGLIALDTRVFVLHTDIDRTTNKLTGMYLSVLKDDNRDGVADGPPVNLVNDISVASSNQSRGADHTTNGIRMGIDGWIYVAVGDFGMVRARGTDGRELTMLGGGILRVRPDGSEMETYSHGTRNIYDVAIDPFLNVFTRDNTNDGGGWNIRFTHHVQTAEYGYPLLFKHFTNEILPALQDLGGGSGTGCLFLDEPGWPEKYNRQPLMCDWGRSQMYLHRLKPDGATFTQTPEDFIKLSQVTDVDVDGSGRLYMSAWDGAGYSGNPGKGFVERIVPKNWQYRPFPDLARLPPESLFAALKSPGATARLHSQQALVKLGPAAVGNGLYALCADRTLSLESRVAALFALKQVAGVKANPALVKLAEDPAVREFALRALADRTSQLEGVPLDPFLAGLKDPDPRVRVAAAIGLGRLGRPEAAPALLAVASPPADAPDVPGGVKFHTGVEGPHATPNAPMVLPHVAVQALRALRPVDALLAALDGPNRPGALWAMLALHDARLVDGLLARLPAEKTDSGRNEILGVLARLQKREKAYDGSWWWQTRPDTHGPYYVIEDWEKSAAIGAAFTDALSRAAGPQREFLNLLIEKNRMTVEGVKPETAAAPDAPEPKVDLGQVAAGSGEVGKAAIEDVLVAVKSLKGDRERGRELFTRQGCIVCHTVSKTEKPKGPYMGHVGSILTADQIAESILKPSASISQGFATVIIMKKDGGALTGFVSKEAAEEIEVRDITGTVTRVKTADIATRTTMETSIMPPGLANALSFQDFASLVAFLAGNKE